MTDLTPTRMTDAKQVREFMLAGKATLTLVSVKTETRFTYRVTKPEAKEGEQPGPVTHFVALLNGPDNETNYAYMGQFYRAGDYRHGRKSRIHEGAPAAVAFTWFVRKLERGVLPDTLEVWHEGRCGACGLKLTVPSSIESGFGPECRRKRGIVTEKRAYECIPVSPPWGMEAVAC